MPRGTKVEVALSCPVPIASTESVLLGHGSGGRMSGDLLRNISSGLAKSSARTVGRSSHRRGRRLADCIYDRLLRGEAAVFPRRRHRNAGSQRHGERSGDGRRRAAFSEPGFDFGGRLPARYAAPSDGIDSRGRGHRARGGRHRRYESRRKGKRRRVVREHFGNRPGSAWRGPFGRSGASRRLRAAQRHDWRSRDYDSFAARRARIRKRDRERYSGLAHACGRHAAREPEDSLPARPDPRRPLEFIE